MPGRSLAILLFGLLCIFPSSCGAVVVHAQAEEPSDVGLAVKLQDLRTHTITKYIWDVSASADRGSVTWSVSPLNLQSTDSRQSIGLTVTFTRRRDNVPWHMLVGELLITNDDDAVDDAPITITQPKLYVTGSAGGKRTQLPPKAVRCAALAVQPGEPLLCKFHVAYKGDYRRSKTPKAGTVSATVVVPAQGDAAAMNFTAEPVPFDFNKSTHETWGDFALVNDWFETGDGLLDNSMYGTVTGFQPPSGLTLGGSSVYNFSIGPQPMADLKPLCSQQWKVINTAELTPTSQHPDELAPEGMRSKSVAVGITLSDCRKALSVDVSPAPATPPSPQPVAQTPTPQIQPIIINVPPNTSPAQPLPQPVAPPYSPALQPVAPTQPTGDCSLNRITCPSGTWCADGYNCCPVGVQACQGTCCSPPYSCVSPTECAAPCGATTCPAGKVCKGNNLCCLPLEEPCATMCCPQGLTCQRTESGRYFCDEAAIRPCGEAGRCRQPGEECREPATGLCCRVNAGQVCHTPTAMCCESGQRCSATPSGRELCIEIDATVCGETAVCRLALGQQCADSTGAGLCCKVGAGAPCRIFDGTYKCCEAAQTCTLTGPGLNCV